MQSLRSRWGKAISRKEFAASLHGVLLFPRATELGDYMTRAMMATTRTRVYHVSNGDAGTSHAITGECLTTMLYESFVRQVITCRDRCSEDGRPEVRPTIHLGHVDLWAFGFGLRELSWYWIHSWRRMLQDMLREKWVWELSTRGHQKED